MVGIQSELNVGNRVIWQKLLKCLRGKPQHVIRTWDSSPWAGRWSPLLGQKWRQSFRHQSPSQQQWRWSVFHCRRLQATAINHLVCEWNALQFSNRESQYHSIVWDKYVNRQMYKQFHLPKMRSLVSRETLVLYQQGNDARNSVSN